MSWELASFAILAAVLLGGFAWYERSRPPAQIVALVAALAALAVAGRVAFAALPNVVATTDVVIFSGFALGAAPGFAVGALAGLVSNFWLGQGPWTPWQMAGWGICGVLGAALALVRPRAGRFSLALLCALAAVAYGALLNFSLMATYGGDLTLQRFLALQSRAVPFDAAHAIGNASLALVAGPALVRMLARFRERFEWRAPAVASLLLLALALASVLPAGARASEASRAATWLVAAQNADGGWGSSPDRDSAPDMTAWAMLGLEATGRNPLDVSRGGRNPVAYLRSHVAELESPGDFARTILALRGAGVDVRSFGGRDLASALAKRRRSNGSFLGWPGSTAFAILALRSAGAGGVEASISWLVQAQNRDGGWGDTPGSPSTADVTGAVVQAIPGTDAARHGLGFLRNAQRPSGGFAPGGSGEVNSQSTAWAAQGMLAMGKDPATFGSGKSALDYLAARQNGDGSYAYSPSSDQTPVWVTGQALAAVAGAAFPLAPVARSAQPSLPVPSGAPGTGTGSDFAAPLPLPAPSTGSTQELFEQFGQSDPGGATAPPTGGGGSGIPSVPPATDGGSAPLPAPGETEGAGPEAGEAQPAAVRFEAGDHAGPKPWAPVGIGLAGGGIALATVLLLGRRFSW